MSTGASLEVSLWKCVSFVIINVTSVKLFESFNKDNKKVISVKIHFKQLNAALSFMDELNRSVGIDCYSLQISLI